MLDVDTGLEEESALEAGMAALSVQDKDERSSEIQLPPVPTKALPSRTDTRAKVQLKVATK